MSERREYERERIKTWAAECIAQAMGDMSKSDLARKLGTSRAWTTKLLQAEENFTLVTLADIAFACGHRITLTVEPLPAKRRSKNSEGRASQPVERPR